MASDVAHDSYQSSSFDSPEPKIFSGTRKKSKRACMLAYSFFENDMRVRKYAESLHKSGWHVDAFALKKYGQPSHEVMNGIHIFRIQFREKNEKEKKTFLFRLIKFLILSTWHISVKSLIKKYDIIHVHSVPDFEVFATFLAKLMGSRIILDIHDPVPDFFAAKFDFHKSRVIVPALKVVELVSTLYADHVITVTDYWRDVIRRRSHIPDRKISVILNLPDTSLFDNKKYPLKKEPGEIFNLIYPGSISKHCGLDIALKAVKIAGEEITSLRFKIFGSGNDYDAIIRLVKILELEQIVSINESVPVEDVPGIMSKADAGIALLAGNNNYARHALNVKLFEYFAMGLPAIATRTESTEYYLNEEIVMFSKMDDSADVARCIKELYHNPEKRARLSRAGRDYIEKNNWSSQMGSYFKTIESLAGKNK